MKKYSKKKELRKPTLIMISVSRKNGEIWPYNKIQNTIGHKNSEMINDMLSIKLKTRIACLFPNHNDIN